MPTVHVSCQQAKDLKSLGSLEEFCGFADDSVDNKYMYRVWLCQRQHINTKFFPQAIFAQLPCHFVFAWDLSLIWLEHCVLPRCVHQENSWLT